jgi:hypothetical protein
LIELNEVVDDAHFFERELDEPRIYCGGDRSE